MSMEKTGLKVAVMGASGYTGGELLRLLLGHPGAKVVALSSEAYEGLSVEEVFPSLRGFCNLKCRRHDPGEMAGAELVFLALPHKASMEIAPDLLRMGKRVVDLSADFRFKDPALYEKWYNIAHSCPELLKESIYGLPELYRDRLKSARLVGVPGCYPTGAILGLAPLIEGQHIDLDSIIVDSISGASGAGRKLDLGLHFAECDGSVKAYGVAGHRHTPEIEQELSFLAGVGVKVSFTPHLAPFTRGILSTIYARLVTSIDTPGVISLYAHFYKKEPFIRVLPMGRYPETKQVLGSNFCDIGIRVDEGTGRVVIITAIDNLGKGASGAAVQCMNIMSGLDEGLGLMSPGLFP